MTTVITRETYEIGNDESIFDDETRITIRENLKKAVGYNTLDNNVNKEYDSEMHHRNRVPFEGNVYTGAGNSLDTKQINKQYKKSLPSLWWLVSQSMVAFIRRIIH